MKDHRKLYFFIVAILVGLFVTLQLKSNYSASGIITIPKLLAMQNEIENTKNEIKLLQQSSKDAIDKLKEYEDSIVSTGSIYGKMQNELRDNRNLAGFERVEGPGIVITLNDSQEEVTNDLVLDWILVHDSDILELVNELRAAGAEAISINGERVIATTSIRCGGPTIIIDEKRHAIPFVIKAIGDPQKLRAMTAAPDNYLEWLYYRGVSAQVEMSDNLIIDGYNGKQKITFQKKAEGGENK